MIHSNFPDDKKATILMHFNSWILCCLVYQFLTLLTWLNFFIHSVRVIVAGGHRRYLGMLTFMYLYCNAGITWEGGWGKCPSNILSNNSFLATELEDYIKSWGESGEKGYVFKDWLKPILPLFLTLVFCKLKFVIPWADFHPPPIPSRAVFLPGTLHVWHGVNGLLKTHRTLKKLRVRDGGHARVLVAV